MSDITKEVIYFRKIGTLGRLSRWSNGDALCVSAIMLNRERVIHPRGKHIDI